MEIKMFYKSQREVAKVINALIDGYWDNEITEQQLIESFSKLIEHNRSKITKDGEYTSVIEQKCGIRRIEVLSAMLTLIDRGGK